MYDIGISAGVGLLGLQGPEKLKKTTITGESAGTAKRLETEAKKILNRAIEIINKTERKLPMPRISKYRDHFECRYCSWQDRCWSHE